MENWRFQKSYIDYDRKHSIILSNCSLSELAPRYIYQRTLHGGIQLMLSIVRDQYWIVDGRLPVKVYIRKCVTCARHRAKTAQLVGQLPPRRVISARPFLYAGVDHAGPFTLLAWRHRDAETYEGFLVVFICVTTLATHLKLASDYSTEGFLVPRKRFTAKKGIGSTLIIDCGRNLVEADSTLVFSAKLPILLAKTTPNGSSILQNTSLWRKVGDYR